MLPASRYRVLYQAEDANGEATITAKAGERTATAKVVDDAMRQLGLGRPATSEAQS